MGSRQGRLASWALFRAHKLGLVKEICRDGGGNEGDQVTKAHLASRVSLEAYGTQKAQGTGADGDGGRAEAERDTSSETLMGPAHTRTLFKQLGRAEAQKKSHLKHPFSLSGWGAPRNMLL